MKATQETVWLNELMTLIREKPALQFFFQNFFENAGIYGAPPSEAELLPRAVGQRDVALDVKSLLDTHDPTLYYELQLQRINYLMQTGKIDQPDTPEDDEEE